MSTTNLMHQALKWIHPKNTDQNLVAALIHMLSISLISMSLVELKWFEISATVGMCAPFLSMTQFFTYGYTEDTAQATDNCLNSTTVNMMRIIILLSFMAIIFSLCGFYIEIISPKGSIYIFIRRFALISTCTVLWIMAIIASCYYVAILLEESFLKTYPVSDITVTYGYGFYLIACTGGLNLLGTFFSLLFMYNTNITYRNEDNYLIDGFEESIDNFHNPPPPPPYNVPPPPYVP